MAVRAFLACLVALLVAAPGASASFFHSTTLTGFPPAPGLNQPIDVATDNAGNVYVSDGNGLRVVKLDPNGVFIAEFKAAIIPGNLYSNRGIAVRGNDVFVADSGNNRVIKFSTNMSEASATIFKSGLNQPTGVAVPSANRIYVAEGNAGLFKRYNAAGVVQLTAFTGPQPQALDVDAAGNVWVVERLTGLVTRYAFNATSPNLTIDGSTGAGLFQDPRGIDVEQAGGRVYVTEIGTDRVQIYRTDGSYINMFTSPGANAGTNTWGVHAAGQFGALYVSESGENQIERFVNVEPDTTFTTTPGPYSMSSANFTWTSVNGTGTECQLDAGGWSVPNCNQPLTGLSEGSHTFEARSFDNYGNVETSPASHTWIVDLTAPTIDAAFPSEGGRYVSTSTKPHLADYSCSDNFDPEPSCVGDVADGVQIDISGGTNNGTPKTFTITATDAAGNVSAPLVISYETYTFKGLIKDDDPLAYWRLGEPSGWTWMEDSSGNGNHGDYKNANASAPFGISGDNNKARHFLADNGYAYVNGITAPKYQFTIGAWVRLDDLNNDGLGDNGTIMEHGGGGTLYVKDQKPRFRHVENRSESVELEGTTILDPHVFYHVVATWDGIKSRLYVDGWIEDEEFAYYPEPSGISTLYLAFGNGSGVGWLKGFLDEATYFDYALSDEEIHEHFLADPPPVEEVVEAPVEDAPADVAAADPPVEEAVEVEAPAAVEEAGYGDEPAAEDETVPDEGVQREEESEAAVPTVLGTWVRPGGAVIEIAERGDGYRGTVYSRASKGKCQRPEGAKVLKLNAKLKGTITERVKRKGKCKTRKLPVKASLGFDGNTLTLVKKAGKKKLVESLSRIV